MLSILALIFPFFALVLCGYLAVRRHVLPQLAIPGLNIFVLYFALPCLLFRFGANSPIAQLLDPAVFCVYLLCALIMVGLTIALTLGRPADWNNASFGALVAAFPNTGFMGVPLLIALLGPRSSATAIVTMAIDLIITSSLCVALSRLGDSPSSEGSGAALRDALARMLRNPMPWSILLGVLAAGGGAELPAPLDETIRLLSDAASPAALFTIGAVLARAHMSGAAAAPTAAGANGASANAASANAASPIGAYLPVALLKLVVHPLLVYATGSAAIALGVPLDPYALTVLVLVACLPSASNVAMLAERFGADTGRIARIILVSTALSFLTITAAMALLAPG